MLQFDAATARLLENAYRGSDVVKRRLATLEALAPEAGDVIVDVGSGPGYLTLELARAVAEAGEVIAVDPSSDMRKAAAASAMG
jgi:arsenite methyltransferase